MTSFRLRTILVVCLLALGLAVPAVGAASTPTISLDPSSGASGTSVTVTGLDFPRERGDLHFGDQRVARFRADKQGTFTVRFTVPTVSDGTYVVTAKAGNASDTADFVVGVPPTTQDPVAEEPVAEEPATSSGNPVAAAPLYVDPHSNARNEAAKDPANAYIWNRIGDHAQADWFGDWYPTSDVRAIAANRASTIRNAGAQPLFVVYAIPQRDCGGYSSGGTNNPDAYRAWVEEFAAGISGGISLVVLEPDALPQLDCLSGSDRTARLQLLSEAIDTLNAAGAAVYVDAGHSNWVPSSTMAQRLLDAGVSKARGFSLNVSNYNWTQDEVAYGTTVSGLIGDKTFIVDTSRNGLGPSTDTSDPEPWCNPEGRGLGTPSTAATGNALVDGYLWVKRPGESDGTCKGGPSAGSWWRDYAFGLADRAPWAS